MYKESSQPKHQWFDVILVLILTFIYFLIFLGTRHLSVPDEGRYPEVAREMLTSGNWITPMLNGIPFLDKPILYYWLEAISMKCFGVNAWTIRLPQCLFGIFGTLAIYLFGCKLFSRRVGILAAVILSTSPLYFFAAHYADMDLEVANLLWISALCFLVGLQYEYPSRSHRFFIYLAYAFAGFSFFNKRANGYCFSSSNHRIMDYFFETMATNKTVVFVAWSSDISYHYFALVSFSSSAKPRLFILLFLLSTGLQIFLP